MELYRLGHSGLARPLTAPAWSAERWALAALAGVTILRLVVAAAVPLSPDEAYYWVWSRALAPGYLDHPPMVALWIRAGTLIAGQTALGVRLLAPFSTALGSVLLWQAARDLLGEARAGLLAAVLLNATLLVGAGSVTMTPDTPLLLFWTAALWATGRLIVTGRGGWWIAIGAACGLALCSKYTAALLPAGLLLWLIWTRQGHWFTRPVLWLSVLLGVGLFSPVLWWNAHHGWASFAKQGGRSFVFHPARLLGHLGELLAGQAGLATPLIFVLCVMGVVQAVARARRRAPGPALLACLVLPAAAIFVEHAFGDRVQANWPAIVYPAAAIAATLAPPGLWRRLFVPGVVLGAGLTLLVYLQSTLSVFALPAKLDPTLRVSGGFVALDRTLLATADARGAGFVSVDEYATASLLDFLSPGCRPIVGLEPRWALFDLPDARGMMAGKSGLLLRTQRRRTAPASQDWDALAPVATLTRGRDGRIAETYTLYQGAARAGRDPAVLLPCRSGAGPGGNG